MLNSMIVIIKIDEFEKQVEFTVQRFLDVIDLFKENVSMSMVFRREFEKINRISTRFSKTSP